MLEINKIYNEDCFVGLKEIDSGSVPLIVTDPPYYIRYGSGGSVNTVKKLDISLKQLDEAEIVDGYDIEGFAKEVERLQGDNINIYLWCNKTQIADYMRVYVGEMGCKYEIICWHKINALPTYGNKYLSDTEYCLFFHRGKGQTHPSNYEDAKTYFMGQINSKDKTEWGHPTIKPIEYIRTMIRNSSNEGDLVLDPFMGSGTTALAAVKENRNFIGFEINKEFYEKACERVKQFTNQESLF